MANQLTEEMFDWLNANCRADIVEAIQSQTDRIAELEKDGKVCGTCGGLVYDPVLKQTKPLSDEEILKIADNLQESNQPYNINFARAIEAKVRGEK